MADAPAVIEPVTLVGSTIRLEPLSLDHLDGLAEIGLDPELWRWIGFPVRTREDLRRYIEDALRDREAGRAMPFATVLLDDRRADRIDALRQRRTCSTGASRSAGPGSRGRGSGRR